MSKQLLIVLIVALISSSATYYFGQRNFVSNLDASLKQLYETEKLVLDPLAVKEFQALKKQAQIELSQLEQLAEKGKNIHSTLDAILAAQAVKFGLVSIQSGVEKIHSKDLPSLIKPEGCEPNRGIIGKKVFFDRPYDSPPKVIASFSFIDFRSGADVRARIEVKDITTEYFVLDLATWCDTRTSQIAATWLAVGI